MFDRVLNTPFKKGTETETYIYVRLIVHIEKQNVISLKVSILQGYHKNNHWPDILIH